ncbi:MAG: glycosyltransferase family 2 protein [Deltaproteobacteria bacterium]|nr:glycosyltransferase family 2 protein [Deltaproteobacteria bacterium]
MDKVYILLVNWNGWADTLECLESVFRNTYKDYCVIVCDNGSRDGSLGQLKAWAEGRLDILPASPSLKRFSWPPVPKPIPYIEYNRQEAEKCGHSEEGISARLILIQSGEDLGFAGGTNIELRYILARNDFKHVWLLNNDTVIHPDALQHLLKEVSDSPPIGICGSTLLYYHTPNVIQALGGASFNKWFSLSHHIGAFKKFPVKLKKFRVLQKTDYVIGASMLVSRSFLLDAGLMNEDYFAYYEELDWMLNAKNKHEIGYAPESLVYHKEGISLGGTRRKRKDKSFLSDYFTVRSRFIFTMKFYPYCLPTVLFTTFVKLCVFALRRQWDRIQMTLKLTFKLFMGGRPLKHLPGLID